LTFVLKKVIQNFFRPPKLGAKSPPMDSCLRVNNLVVI